MLVKKCKENVCWVTFKINLGEAQSVQIAGEWNGWKRETMKKGKDGTFWITKRLTKGRYKFKYVVNDTNWINDDKADDYVPNPFGGTDSLLILE